MSDQSRIEWTEATWSPTTGCDRVSDGCDRCYALTMAARLKAMGQAKYQTDGDPRTSGPGFGLAVHEDALSIPLRWRKPRRVFVNSMSDLFHADVPDGFIAQVWEVMAQCPQHTFQVLTKRHARMRSWLQRWHDTTGDELVANKNGLPPMPRGPEAVRQVYSSPRAMLFADMLDSMGTPPEGAAYPLYDWAEGPRWFSGVLPNVWVGVSVEDQHWADIRIPALLDTPAAVRWLSCEPLIGPVHISQYLFLTGSSTAGPFYDHAGRRRHGGGVGGQTIAHVPSGDLHWVVAGGESGRGARPLELDWLLSLRDECAASGTAFFVKQLGSRWGANHHDIDAFPADLRVREYPTEVAVR